MKAMSQNETIEGCRLIERIEIVDHTMCLHPCAANVYVCERCGIDEVTHPDRNPVRELCGSLKLLTTRCAP